MILCIPTPLSCFARQDHKFEDDEALAAAGSGTAAGDSTSAAAPASVPVVVDLLGGLSESSSAAAPPRPSPGGLDDLLGGLDISSTSASSSAAAAAQVRWQGRQGGEGGAAQVRRQGGACSWSHTPPLLQHCGVQGAGQHRRGARAVCLWLWLNFFLTSTFLSQTLNPHRTVILNPTPQVQLPVLLSDPAKGVTVQGKVVRQSGGIAYALVITNRWAGGINVRLFRLKECHHLASSAVLDEYR